MRAASLWRGVVGALLLVPALAWANKPVLLQPDTAYEVDDPKVSWAFFVRFQSGEEFFVSRLRLEGPFSTLFEILVPRVAELKEHRPAYAVVGPGLPAPTDAERAALPRPLPPGWGAYVDLNTPSPRPTVFEGVMRTAYWSSGPVALALPAGTFELWMWSPQRTRGKSVLSFGVEEKVTAEDFGRLLERWGEYAY